MHPPRVPALQRALGNTDPLGQLLHPPVAQTGPQGTGQNHRSGQVDATTQEPNRHRCVAFVANRAGETQVPSIGFTRIAAARSSSMRRRNARYVASSNALWHIGRVSFVLAD